MFKEKFYSEGQDNETSETTDNNFKEQAQERKEKKELDIDFYITDHNLRHPDDVSPDQTRNFYNELKKQGIDSVRFDWDWDKTFPERGKINREEIDRYIETIKIMQEEGLKPSTIVLSTPPKWANDLYRQNKDEYFQAYSEYTDTAATVLKEAGVKVEQAQLFNEINHPFLFKFVELEDFPKVAELARSAFAKQKMDTKLSTSIIVGNVAEGIAGAMKKIPGSKNKPDNLNEFMDRFERIKDYIDIISVDYYPGMWHYPLQPKENKSNFPIKKSSNPLRELANKFNRVFKNMEMLKPVCERLTLWNKDYEIGETGLPTNMIFGPERRQRMFYDMYFRAFRRMFIDFQNCGIKLPLRIGLYEVQDEQNRFGNALVDKIISSSGVNKLSPEGYFGLYTKAGEKKEILKGKLKNKNPSKKTEEMSQLQNLIRNLKRPLPDEKEKE